MNQKPSQAHEIATAGSESDGCYAAHNQALKVKYEHPIVPTDVGENDSK